MSEQDFDFRRETPRVLEHIVATDFEGGEGVLVDLNTKKYYQLNETAMVVWRGLEKRQGFEEIVAEMTGSYEVTSERARASVERILSSFLTFKLVGLR